MASLEVGEIIYIYNGQIAPAKNKYTVCVHIKPHLFLCINSVSRVHYECMPILKKKNSFLDHDSYIACNRVFTFEEIDLKNSQRVGSLGYEDLLNLRKHIRNNVKTLSKADKEKIIISLDEAILEQI